ncbi:MAG: ABC transporter ATP-binding protein, partial [Pseudomonadota bacterium]
MLRMSVLRHQHHASGDLANRLTVDIDRLRLAGTNNAINLAVNLLTMAGMLVVMLWLNWQLALIALAALPAFHLLTARMMALILEQSRRFRASDGALAGEAVHAAGAAQAIQGLSLYAPIAAVFGRGSERNLALGMRSAILKTVLRQSVTVLFAVCIGLLVWRGAVLVEAGAITPGDLIIFMAYLREGMEKPMIRFSANLAELGRGAASGERLLALLDEPAEPEAETEAAVPPRRGVIRFEDVSFGYPGRPLVLDGASFSLAPGERVAIVGPSGGGKSTVIALLLRLVEPAGGRITIDGVDIAAMGRA